MSFRFKALTMNPEVLFAACGDERLPILSFLEQALHLPEGYYFPIRIAGGLSPLAHEEIVPHDFRSLLRHLNVLTHKPTITSAIILEHADCTWRKAHLPAHVVNEGAKDLFVIADVLKENFPQLTSIQLWYADLIGGEFDFKKAIAHSQKLVLV